MALPSAPGPQPAQPLGAQVGLSHGADGLAQVLAEPSRALQGGFSGEAQAEGAHGRRMADDLDRLLDLLPEPVRLALAPSEARDQLL